MLVNIIKPLLGPAHVALDRAVTRILPVKHEDGLAQVARHRVDEALRLGRPAGAHGGIGDEVVEADELPGGKCRICLCRVARVGVARVASRIGRVTLLVGVPLGRLDDHEVGVEVGDVDAGIVTGDVHAIERRFSCA